MAVREDFGHGLVVLLRRCAHGVSVGCCSESREYHLTLK